MTSWSGPQRWCDHLVATTRTTRGIGGCPIGSLVSELADRSDSARLELERSFAEWQSYLSTGFAVMRDNGELALTMMSALQGGLLMALTTRIARPLELALDMTLGHIA